MKGESIMSVEKKFKDLDALKAGLEVEFEGYGYAYEQNIKANTVLTDKEKLMIKLKDKEI